MDATSTQTVSGSGGPVIVEGENRYRDVEVVDNARTLELSDEEAERLMPQPTTKAPWFGYESYADYGDEGWDAVADNSSVDGKADRGSAKASSASDAKDTDGPSASKGGDISTSVGDVTVQDNSTTNVDVGDVKINVPISCSLNTSDADGGASDGGQKGAGRDNKK